MNYIYEINKFQRWLDSNYISSSAITLWYTIIHIANKSGWEDELSIPISFLEAKTRLSKPTLLRARKELKEAGFLEIKNRDRMAALYILISINDKFNEKENDKNLSTEISIIDKEDPNKILSSNFDDLNNKTLSASLIMDIPANQNIVKDNTKNLMTDATINDTIKTGEANNTTPFTMDLAKPFTTTFTTAFTTTVPLYKQNETKPNITKPNNLFFDCTKEKIIKEKGEGYGKYKNVLLSTDEFYRLKELFPNDYSERIERLSTYLASSGKQYKSHLATIESWANREKTISNKKENIKKGGFFDNLKAAYEKDKLFDKSD